MEDVITIPTEEYDKVLTFIRSHACSWCGNPFTGIDTIEYDNHDPPTPMCASCWHDEMFFPCEDCGEMVYKPDVEPKYDSIYPPRVMATRCAKCEEVY